MKNFIDVQETGGAIKRHFQPVPQVNIFTFQAMAEDAKIQQTGGLRVGLSLEDVERMQRVRKPFTQIAN
jgi:hypothetical protein